MEFDFAKFRSGTFVAFEKLFGFGFISTIGICNGSMTSMQLLM
jgi:hypothetical protein